MRYYLYFTLCTFSILSNTSIADGQISKELEKAKTLFYAGTYDSSIIVLNNFIAKFPENADAYYYRGLNSFYLYKDNEAVSDFSKSISLLGNTYRSYRNPDNEEDDAWLMRGETYGYRIKDYNNALSDYNKSISLNPSNPRGHYIRGAFESAELKNNVAAITDISKAISLDSLNFYYRAHRADIYFEATDYLKASEDFEKAIGLADKLDAETQAEVYFRLGVSYSKLGNNNSALNSYLKLLSKLPDDVSANYNTGLCYYRGGNYSEACKYFQKACNLGDNDACTSVSQLNCTKYTSVSNNNCDELSIDDLVEIIKSNSDSREQTIRNKGLAYSHSEDEPDALYNSGTTWKRKFYTKCNTLNDSQDFYCHNKIYLSWNLQDNSINYATTNYENFQKMYNDIVFISHCEKQQLDINLSDINKSANSNSYTSFMEVYCCQSNCYGFMKVQRTCEASKEKINVYIIAVRPR